jgi:hypothetical protein
MPTPFEMYDSIFTLFHEQLMILQKVIANYPYTERTLTPLTLSPEAAEFVEASERKGAPIRTGSAPSPFRKGDGGVRLMQMKALFSWTNCFILVLPDHHN